MSKKERRAKAAREITYDTQDWRKRLYILPLLALALVLIVEFCNRHLSVAALAAFVAQHPLIFAYNWLIILTTLVFSELFKRRRAVLTTLTLLWVVLGVVQFIVVKNRTQPFCSVDILMLKDAFSLITIYFTWPQIILMFGCGFLLVALVVMVFTRMRRREKRNFSLSLIAFVGFVLLCFMIAALGTNAGYFPQRFENMVDAYNDYGFATCFAFTFGQQGIARPTEYSTETVSDIVTELVGGEDGVTLTYPTFDEADNLTHPNIIYVQLESFFDVNTIEGATYSTDPTPWFNRLCTRFPSGLMYVPMIGGGTANTEFEVLTGLNLDFFGAGEYPYNTVMQTTACESICTDLKQYGYTTTALHNNNGTFYSRNIVYGNLGFDRFVPLEYMHDAKYTPIGWAQDEVLTGEIMQALRTTEGRDMIMCIAVESHGKYAETFEPQEGDIEIDNLPEGIPLAPFQNYVRAIHSTDQNFLMKLIISLIKFDEPTIVVAYGDHLPALELEADMLATKSLYASRYVIWNNYGASFEAPDLQAYRLTANLTGQLGFAGGVISRLNQSTPADDESPEYLSKLEMLEYDMLYGDHEALEEDYQPTELIMGTEPIVIEDAALEYRRLLVTGENFTEFSTLLINDQPVDTAYIDSNHIIARVDDGAEVEHICVAQICRDGGGTELGRTEPFELVEK